MTDSRYRLFLLNVRSTLTPKRSRCCLALPSAISNSRWISGKLYSKSLSNSGQRCEPPVENSKEYLPKFHSLKKWGAVAPSNRKLKNEEKKNEERERVWVLCLSALSLRLIKSDSECPKYSWKSSQEDQTVTFSLPHEDSRNSFRRVLFFFRFPLFLQFCEFCTTYGEISDHREAALKKLVWALLSAPSK